jgi:hypothetical protein
MPVRSVDALKYGIVNDFDSNPSNLLFIVTDKMLFLKLQLTIIECQLRYLNRDLI